METCDHIIAVCADEDGYPVFITESEARNMDSIDEPFLHCPKCGVSCHTAKRLNVDWIAREAERELERQLKEEETKKRKAYWKEVNQREYDKWAEEVMSKIQTKPPPQLLPQSLDAAIEAYKTP